MVNWLVLLGFYACQYLTMLRSHHEIIYRFKITMCVDIVYSLTYEKLVRYWRIIKWIMVICITICRFSFCEALLALIQPNKRYHISSSTSHFQITIKLNYLDLQHICMTLWQDQYEESKFLGYGNKTSHVICATQIVPPLFFSSSNFYITNEFE